MSKKVDKDDFEFLQINDNEAKIVNKKKKTYYLFVLDRSGSMAGCKDATINGFNEQVETVRGLSDKYKDQEFIVSLVTFADYGDIKYDLWNQEVNDIQPLTDNDYEPSGLTCLCDALGHSLDKMKEDIKEELKDKDTTVIVSIFTDGYENASHDFKHKDIADLSKEMQSTDQWTFTYVGANQDVMTVAEQFNIPISNTMAYTSNVVGTKMSQEHMSKGLMDYAKSKSVGGEIKAQYFSQTDKVLDITDIKDQDDQE